MFKIGSRVKYTKDYIREFCEDGMDKIYAGAWRGRIIEDYGTGVYLVCDAEFPSDEEDICGTIIEIAED